MQRLEGAHEVLEDGLMLCGSVMRMELEVVMVQSAKHGPWTCRL